MQNRIGFGFFALLFSVLTGCSQIELFYDHADWYVLYKIDGYFDIDDRQEEFLEGKVAEFHAWHREEEIPRLIAFLKTAKLEFGKGLRAEHLQWAEEEFQQMKSRIADRIGTDVAIFLSTLSDEQVAYFREKLDKDNEEYEEKMAIPEEEWREEEQERVLERVEEWFGDTTEEQKQAIAKDLESNPWDRKAYRRQRKLVQAEIVALLNERREPTDIQSVISSWFINPSLLRNDEYDRAVKDRQASRKVFWLEMDRKLTDRQRQHAVEELQEYIEDFQSIHEKG